MKKHTFSLTLLLLLAGLGILPTSSLTAAPDPQPAKMYRVTAVTKYQRPIIEPGMWRSDVRDLIGAPNKRITPDVWLYLNREPSLEKARTDGCSRLVIAFEHGRVSSLQLVNARAEAIIVARAKSGQTSPETLLTTVPEAAEARFAGKVPEQQK